MRPLTALFPLFLLVFGGCATRPELTSASRAPDEVSWIPLSSGIRYYAEEDPSGPWAIFAVEADLSQNQLEVVGTKTSRRGATVSEFARETGVEVAINADFFEFPSFSPQNVAFTHGVRWPDSPRDTDRWGWIAFGKFPDHGIEISPPAEVRQPSPKSFSTVVGGYPMVVDKGVPIQSLRHAKNS